MPYDKIAVDAAIRSSNRAGRRIGARERQLIHGLLRGRQPIKVFATEAQAFAAAANSPCAIRVLPTEGGFKVLIVPPGNGTPFYL